MSSKEKLQEILASIQIDVESSASEIKHFMDSQVFRDFCNELDIRTNYLKELLHDEGLEYTGRDYDVFRGGIRTHVQLKQIFEDLYESRRDYEEAKNAINRQIEGVDNE